MCRVKFEMIYIMSAAASFRVEKDLLGTLEVPADAYYGIQTLRAANNFHLSGVPLSHYPKLVVALESGRGVLELVREEGLLDEEMLNDILRPENMIAPRLVPLKA